MPKGFKVEVLDEMDPDGSALSDFVESAGPSGAASIATVVPTTSPVANIATVSSTPTGECPCTQAQLGQTGCCGGQSAICDWISNEPKVLGKSS
jgi:hypothetical protein